MTDPVSPAAPPSATHHLPVLDGVRGLAILLVMPSHFWGLAFGIAGKSPGNPLDRFLGRLFGSGWVGVDLFFVLSGFLITGILLDARSSPFYFRNFYARRFLRIFPLYYGFLIVTLVLVPYSGLLSRVAAVDNLRANQWWYWTYTTNIGYAFTGLSFTGTFVQSQFWSLAVEEQFYLVWPAAVLLLRSQRLAALCVVLVFASFGLRVYLASDAASSFAALNAAHVFTPARMDTFALGALLAIAARRGDALRDTARWAPYVAAAAFVVVAALFVANNGLSALDASVQTVGFTALAFLFAAVIAITVTAAPGSVWRRIFSAAPLTWLGRYAYGLYVVHVFIAFFLADRILNLGWMSQVFLREVGGSQAPANIATTATGIAMSAAIAWLSWHLYESQFLKLKRFVPYGGESSRIRSSEAPPSVSEQPTMSVP